MQGNSPAPSHSDSFLSILKGRPVLWNEKDSIDVNDLFKGKHQDFGMRSKALFFHEGHTFVCSRTMEAYSMPVSICSHFFPFIFFSHTNELIRGSFSREKFCTRNFMQQVKLDCPKFHYRHTIELFSVPRVIQSIPEQAGNCKACFHG